MAGRGGGECFFSLLILTTLYSIESSDIQGSSTELGIEYNNSLAHSARWEVIEEGPCTAPCGGVKVRHLRCVSHWSEGDGVARQEEVDKSLCPSPAPEATVQCKACTGEWHLGNYTECSTSCGKGTKTREVKCMSPDIKGERYLVSPRECAGPEPETTNTCYVTECPIEGKPVSILSENYTYIQLQPSKKIKLVVGGKVKLLPGQTLLVQCPVKNYPKRLITWSKGYKLVSLFGTVRSTPGGLYFENVNPKTDSGVYTCKADTKTSSIDVGFIGDNDGNWTEFKNLALQSRPMKRSKETLAFHTSTAVEDVEQQKDQSINATSFLNYIPGNWTKCTAVCGSSGQMKRNLTCGLFFPKYVKIVPDSECVSAGVVKPETTSVCGQRCAEWRPGRWSQCQAKCGLVGHKTRKVSCVWQSGKAESQSACRAESKPATIKSCKSPKCFKNCRDESRRCSLVRMLKMCRFDGFKKKCCASCLKAGEL